ncbi:retrotransposon hot spot (RHS) protein [Trypanosoma conorhini]|uniref:Retrotransposon hot spot (RHS) protein n=1 Tax=Trypanosoma conorhini TaxID=83891 RepID=A0A422N8N1_9TRYP|nr:retrotransposon hot spot (RHS) protein [Trypanosoma conorhini]RNF01817.1 retrotransposon hot spot (RHS) protein [Trypanosoma conorhini]
MSGGREEGSHAAAAAENPTTNVQRVRRRTRAGPYGYSEQQPLTQRRRAEETPPPRPKWTLESRVEEVLMEGEAPAREMLLNDFLREYVGPKCAVDDDDNVPMGMFARRPDEYVLDTVLLEGIIELPAYQPYALREDLRGLVENGAVTLRDLRGVFSWLYSVSSTASEKLSAALEVVKTEAAGREENERARLEEELASRPLPEGFYDSVFNAKWSQVLEVPEGVGEEAAVRMEVKEGQAPKKSWEFNDGRFFGLESDEVGQFRPPRPTLRVLTSEQGWPHLLREGTFTTDCYVNSEVERVWQIVENDLHELFHCDDGGLPDVQPHFLLGTYGVGRWMDAGAYILYRLLHYKHYPIRYVVYCIGSELAYVFDKKEKTVTKCGGAEKIEETVNQLDFHPEEREFVIYDVAEEGGPPLSELQPYAWGMIVVASPNGNNFGEWVWEANRRRELS